MRMFKPLNLLLPLVLVSVMATGVDFLEPIFGLTGRWILLAALAGYLFVTGGGIGRMSPPLILSLGFYIAWCAMTLVWSEGVTLSAMKVVALIMVAFAALLGGQRWTMRHDSDHALDFLWPYALFSLLAGLIGGGSIPVTLDLVVYEGSAVGPNFLGMIMASSVPVVVWRLYRGRATLRSRLFWAAVSAVYLYILYLTVSRASYLICAGVLAGLLLTWGGRRAMVAAGAAAAGLALFAILSPDLTDAFIQRNFYKANEERNLLHSRQQTWGDSYDGAVNGGWIGIGYGVSSGAELANFSGGVSTAGYGREKANSQLAVIEETGIVGFILYAVFLFFLFSRLAKDFRAAKTGDARVLRGILIGTLGGMWLQSVFESWWVAPGSPEFIYFFIMAGAAVGLGPGASSSQLAPVPEKREARAR